MNDMNPAITPKSDQLNADDLVGGDRVITITGVSISPGAEQPVSISFDGEPRVFRPCKSMSRVLVAVWGPDANAYIGRSLKLYRDPDVTWGGMKVGGIRIREMSDMDGNRAVTLALTEKRGSRKPAVIKPLVIEKKPDPSIEAFAAASVAARRGTEVFRDWWVGDGKSMRAHLGKHMDEIKQLCADADAEIEGDPFGLPPTTEEVEARMQAIADEVADQGPGE